MCAGHQLGLGEWACPQGVSDWTLNMREGGGGRGRGEGRGRGRGRGTECY